MPSTWNAIPGATPADVPADWWLTFDDAQLNELVRTSLAYNKDLVAAAARYDAARAQATISGADRLPSLDASFQPSRSRNVFVGLPIPGTSGVLSTTSTSFRADLTASWELDLWGRLRAGHAAATADAERAAADAWGVAHALAAQTGKAYFALREARAQLALAERTAASFRTTAQQVRDRFEQGTRPAFDLRLAISNQSTSEANVSLRREQVERATRALQILLGRYPSGLLDTASELADMELAPVPTGVPASILSRRPDLVAAERGLAATGARVDQARASLYPRLSLTGMGGTSSNELEDLFDFDFRTWSIAANLLQPIFQGGRLRADVRRNEALVREAAATFETTLLRALSEVEVALAVEDDLANRATQLGSAVESLRAALTQAENRYGQGLADFLTVSDTQRQVLAAESQWLAAKRARFDTRIDLFLALGGGFSEATRPLLPFAEISAPQVLATTEDSP